MMPLCAIAQEKYTDKLKQQNGQGAAVIIHQDIEMEELVNGPMSLSKDSAHAKLQDAVLNPEKTSGTFNKGMGYRVQIYMAGNTAKDKTMVKNWARKFKTHFPTVNAYVYFNSPHWICAAGDFKTREEANEMLHMIRNRGAFTSASIVRSKVNVFK